MIRKFVVASLAVVVAAGVAMPVYAHRSDDVRTVTEKVRSTTEEVTKNAETTVTKTTEEAKEAAREQIKAQRQQIQEKKKELLAEQEQKLEERKAKLEGRRLARCQNRQDKINELIDKSVTAGRERLARIQRLEEGVRNFYQEQSLTSDRFDSVAADVDQKEVAAIAALDVIAEQDFDCSEVDGDKPSVTIRSNHEAKRAALHAYRLSVKELVAVVKEAYAATQTSSEAGN